MKHVLMIAFHFPPLLGSSGLQRTLNFCKHLPAHGWRPTVLTVQPSAYERTSEGQLGDLPADLEVIRTKAFDAARDLAIRGRYLALTARPDRFASWRITAVRAALRAIDRLQPSVVWCTYPIATALQIGLRSSARRNLPLVVDFRDLMVDPDFPVRADTRRWYEQIESECCHQAARVVTTTPSAVRMLVERYPAVGIDRWACIRNGFDESDFARWSAPYLPAHADAPLRLVHSGLLDPADRDPMPFFQALARLHDGGRIGPRDVRIVLRASGHDARFIPACEALGLGSLVEFAPAVGYPEAIREMCTADGLLLFQGPSADHLVPAKLYEYLRAGRPIFGATAPDSESGVVMRDAGLPAPVRIDDVDALADGLASFIAGVRAGQWPVAGAAAAARYGRAAQAGELAALLDEVAQHRLVAR